MDFKKTMEFMDEHAPHVMKKMKAERAGITPSMEEVIPKCPQCGGHMSEDAGVNKQGKFVQVEDCYECDYRKEEDPYKKKS